MLCRWYSIWIRKIQNRLLYRRYLYIRQIFLIQMESSAVLCVSIKGVQNSQVLIQLSPVSCYWTEPCAEENIAVHPTLKKDEKIVQRRRGFSMLLLQGFLYASPPPPFCQKQGKWKHRKYNTNKLCTIHYETSLNSAGCKDTRSWGCILKHCVRDELTRVKNSFVNKYPLLA